MQAPPPLNVNGGTAQAVDGHPAEGPTQDEVHDEIKALSLDNEKGNSANSTSRRLAQTAGRLDGHTFKKTVGNATNGLGSGSTRYILPSDVSEEAFLAFIKQVKEIVGDDGVTVNADPDHQAEADYENQPKFYVSWQRAVRKSRRIHMLMLYLPSHTGLLRNSAQG